MASELQGLSSKVESVELHVAELNSQAVVMTNTEGCAKKKSELAEQEYEGISMERSKVSFISATPLRFTFYLLHIFQYNSSSKQRTSSKKRSIAADSRYV